jgi:macrolide transport system ATP-binding/permease protein
MNGGEIILADEPTGALDSRSGQEVIEILQELHADGHTIIMVTHDINVANTAHRIIEIKDGEIISDKRLVKEELQTKDIVKNEPSSMHPWQGAIDRFTEAFGMALKSMLAHRMRTFLTMLGIIIGIASVVSVIALGEGSRQKILKDISNMGTNTINIYPGKGFGDRDARKIHTLTVADAEILKKQDFIDSVTPSVNDSATVRYKNISVDAQIKGVGEDFFQVRGIEVDKGMMFDSKLVGEYAQVAVIDPNAQKELFGQDVNPVGQTIMLGSVPVRIIGLSKKLSSAFMGADSINIWVPYTTVMSRMLGQSHLTSITVRVSDDVTSTAAEEGINKILEQRHRTKDFYMANLDSIRQTIESTTATMRLLISMIAAIALVVGGIGVMNIMLVSVTERTSEIGVRMAVGARQSDIMQQFLIESVVVCLFGGVLGIGLALLIGEIFGQMSSMFSMIFSIGSIVFAFVCSTLIGVIFGFIPAKNAAKLDPVVALSRE